MAFESLTERLNGVFKKLRGKGKLTEADITSAMRDIRMALLEADVNFKVVKEFVAKTKERCMTAEVMESLSPAQNVVKIVLDELTEMLGSTESKLVFSNRIPNVIMLVGLQGSGKTTAAVKLAYLLKKQGRSPLLAASLSLTLSACSFADAPPASPAPFKAEEVARFDEPWAMTFLPDGRLLVTEGIVQL